MTTSRTSLGTLIFFLLAAAPAWAQFDDDEFAMGLIGRYRGHDQRAAVRVDPRVAFDWGDRSPDRRLTTGNFEVTWEGSLMSQAAGEYRLAALISGGALEIELGGKRVLAGEAEEPTWFISEPRELKFDFHPFRVHYQQQRGPAHIVLYWSGPDFDLEPIGSRWMFHDPAEVPEGDFARGRHLARVLRCGACHDIPAEPERLAAPSLDHFADTLRPAWLLERLQADAAGTPTQRMPHFELSAEQAAAIGAYLAAESEPVDWLPAAARETRPARGKRRREPPVDPVAAGERLFQTMGCRACHELGDQTASSTLFSGGELTAIADKRPARFFEQWLAAPASINRDHRMPVFLLSDRERQHLARYLATLGETSGETRVTGSLGQVEQGKRLVERLNCRACHALPGTQLAAKPLTRLPSTEAWTDSCLDHPAANADRPGYRLSDEDRSALTAFLSRVAGDGGVPHRPQGDVEQLLVERNCLACHTRDGSPGLAGSLKEWFGGQAELEPLFPAMTPPGLDQVGDKLHPAALDAAIARRDPAYRDYLLVRMPQFRLAEAERQQLVDYFGSVDRIPEEGNNRPAQPSQLDGVALRAVGSRLVTADGFGCTSCHQIGSVTPSQAPLNTRGPTLSECGQRIRREWFDRFVRNPARLNRALEMPSVRLAVRGVLDEQLDHQLSAVWDILNEPGFEPPEPNPLRVVRQSGLPSAAQRSVVVTDVVRAPQRTFVKPLLIGLPNRHNVLFDFETASLAMWSIGDTARQRTEGKTWYWEAGGTEVCHLSEPRSEFALIGNGPAIYPEQVGQFPSQLDALQHDGGGIAFRHRLSFAVGRSRELTTVTVRQHVTPHVGDGWSGFRRRLEVAGVPRGTPLRLQLADGLAMSSANMAPGRRTLELREGGERITIVHPSGATWNDDGSVTIAAESAGEAIEFLYETSLAIDQHLTPSVATAAPEQEELAMVPGFTGTRLPLSDEMMPTAMAWRPNGEIVVASLAGRVWTLRDSDGDGLEDDLRPFSDDLAAPYGVAATDDYVDVITKFAVIRLMDDDHDRQADRAISIASGWGHTTDYHDWAVGLPRAPDGSYFVALPCQQDERSEAAAHLRGSILRLVPREPTIEDPSLFRIERLTGGHRFPMGIARRSDGELFVTDNQGNYNPFNELNHVVAPRRFGFINALERRPGFDPPLTPPAIDIPHPWTRSVNGICFLESAAAGSAPFGPYEGHLVGCEYDTRRLVRMTLERVNGEFQGAIYPFSYDAPQDGPPFLGPLACAVSPDGDLYVGGIQDSGWGGGNNIGEIVRLRPNWARLPCGIAEVRATVDGLSISFTRPVDARLAGNPQSYSITSYTRTSTPAYGGEDEQRRTQPVRAASVTADRMRVTLELGTLLAGHVYEVHLDNLAPRGAEFFPAEAHYTMRSVPADRQ